MMEEDNGSRSSGMWRESSGGLLEGSYNTFFLRGPSSKKGLLLVQAEGRSRWGWRREVLRGLLNGRGKYDRRVGSGKGQYC